MKKMHGEEWNKSLKGRTNCAKIHNELARESTIVLKGMKQTLLAQW